MTNEEKLIRAVAQYRDHMQQRGQAFIELYPVDKIPVEAYSNITVPVPLPLALALFGLGTAMLNAHPTAYPPIDPTPEAGS